MRSPGSVNNLWPVAISLALVVAITVFPQHGHEAPPRNGAVVLLAGIGENNHPVSTSNGEAQRFFDQGLILVYAFNHDEAFRSFKRASELDPKLAMAYWGMALALGPNINSDVDPAREKQAFEALQKALSMESPPPERAYIEALARRYSIEPKADLRKLSIDYRNAMKEVCARYPDDLDAATLFAESAMDLRPWKLWTKDGKPAEGTEEILTILESVLKRNPNHIGANHYYIHAVEASPNPERALPSAARLERQVTAAGHLVHMPAHIYMRVGDYAAAATSNVKAAEADRAFLESSGATGMYAAGYYSHNLHFLSIAYSMEGRYTDARRASQLLSSNVAPYLKMIPPLETFMPTEILVLARFQKWIEVLDQPAPDKSLGVTTAVWHWARAMAFASKSEREGADRELKLFSQARKALPADSSWSLNPADAILGIAENVLQAKLASNRGDATSTIAFLQRAVEAEDALAYDEPPVWFLPSREALGGEFLRQKNYQAAEGVFRRELLAHPRSGRALFGLLTALRGEGKKPSAVFVQQEFENAWKNAEIKLDASSI